MRARIDFKVSVIVDIRNHGELEKKEDKFIEMFDTGMESDKTANFESTEIKRNGWQDVTPRPPVNP